MQNIIAHADDNHFIVNLYGPHNANLTRKAIPRELFAPIPLYADRQAHHYEVASILRVSQTSKRAITQAKRKATLAANQARKQAARREIEGSSSDDGADLEGGGEGQNELDIGSRGKKRQRK